MSKSNFSYTSLILVARFPVDRDCKTKTGFFELFIFLSCRSLDTAPYRQGTFVGYLLSSKRSDSFSSKISFSPLDLASSGS